MKKGDLVVELTLGKLWFKNNPWLSSCEIGIVTEIVDHNNACVFWPSGQVKIMELSSLEKCNESR